MFNAICLTVSLTVGQAGGNPAANSPPTRLPERLPAAGQIDPQLRGVITIEPIPVVQTEDPKSAKPSAIAEEKKDEEKKDEETPEEDEGPWRLFPDPFAGFKVSGWMYGSGVKNATNGGGTRYNGPMTMNDQEGVYLNQFWININRSLEKDTIGWGANLDVFFGNDYLASLSRGFENARARGWLPKWWNNQDYGMAIPQAYVEVGTSQYNIRVGHFYTPHGYMVVQAPSNFFNTLPYGFMMTNPFTHWGVLANFAITDQLSGMAAIVNGWDALDRPANVASYIGSLKYTFNCDKGFISSTVISGVEPENLGTGYGSRTLVTNILDYKLTEKDEIVIENNLMWQKNHVPNETSFTWSLIPYYFRKLNDCWKIGGRYEVFYDPTLHFSPFPLYGRLSDLVDDDRGLRLGLRCDLGSGESVSSACAAVARLQWAEFGSVHISRRARRTQ